MPITTAAQAKQIIQQRVAKMQSIYDAAMQTMVQLRTQGWTAIEERLREAEEQTAEGYLNDLP